MDVASGEQRVVWKNDGFLSGLSLSPDDGTLATMRPVGNASREHELVLVSISDGKDKVAATVDSSNRVVAGGFTPDGRKVLIARRSARVQEILAVDLATGKAEPVDLQQQANMTYWTLDSSGKRILFSAGVAQNEIWIAENILPSK